MNRNLTVLLADDDENDVLLLEMAFSKVGLAEQLRRVRNGAEAIQYLRGEGAYADRDRYPYPCLLLLDLKMPLLNGFEVLNWIRGQETIKQLVVTVLTASQAECDIRHAYDSFANSYLIKPGTSGGLEELSKKIKDYWLELNVNSPCLQPCAPFQ